MRGVILWDIDGTLLTTGAASREAFLEAMNEATGHPITRLADTAGRTDPVIFRTTLELNGLSEEDGWLARFERLLEPAYRNRISELHVAGRILPGVEAALDACRAAGMMQTVVTGNIRAAARLKLEAFDLLPHFRLDRGAFGDDHADRAVLVELACVRTGNRPAVIIGDTVHDVSAARANRVPVIAVATGRYRAHALTEAGATVVLPDLSDSGALQAALRRCLPAGS